MRKLTYVGAYDSVDTPWGVAERGGEPVEVPSDIAKELIDRGDFAGATTKAAAEAADPTPAPAEKE